MNVLNNEITAPRPHHPLVEDMEALFIGKYQKRERGVVKKFNHWRVVNEWLVVTSICFLLSIAIDAILRF